MAEALDWARVEEAIPLMVDLPLDMRGAVSSCRFAKSSVIFRRGDRPRAMYAVVSGEARLLRTSASGVDVILQRTRSGLFAEASLDQPRYHCDAVAAMPTELIAIPRKVFRLALANDAFRERWLALLLRELRRLRAQNERLCLKTAEERIVHAIEADGDDGRLALNQSRKDWAAELGLTHEALYRALARMEKDRRLRLDGDVIEFTI